MIFDKRRQRPLLWTEVKLSAACYLPSINGVSMEVILLVAAVIVAWILSTTVDQLPSLGQLLVPSKWVVGAVLLWLATWLMRD